MANCIEKSGNKIESLISLGFKKLGLSMIGSHPRKTILACIILTAITGAGFTRWTTESRPDKLWVPQNTIAEIETDKFEDYYARTSRFNNIIVRSSVAGGNVLNKSILMEALNMHLEIATNSATVNTETLTFTDLCTAGGGSCISRNPNAPRSDICSCLVSSIFSLWNYDMDTFENDDDFLATINEAYSKADLEGLFGKATFDGESDSSSIVSAEAFTFSYFTKDLSGDVSQGGTENTDSDPKNEGWENDVFLKVLSEAVPEKYKSLQVHYFAGRSFSDEFGNAITGDILLVNISYVIIFLFLGATLGNVIPGPGSRWTMSLGALVMVGLSVGAGFGVSSAVGLFYGPVHTLIPFILLGIGVDDAFVIVNAFNRERTVARKSETNDDLTKRAGRALARAGASITVTSLTDIVAFGISASSSLPALASFCGYASIGIFFLWLFASTFFSATMVLDERRQRDNRRECLCCMTRKKDYEEDENGFEEGLVSRYFRNYHGPFILSSIGKIFVLVIFAGLFGFGIWGAMNLTVEDTERSFIPNDSYLTGYLNTFDEYYPSSGIGVYFVFESDGSDIFDKKEALAGLSTRLSNKSTEAPFLAEPTEEKFSNVMQGFATHLTNGTTITGITLGDNKWPTNEADFAKELAAYANRGNRNGGDKYASDVIYNDDMTSVRAIRMKSEYVRLVKVRGSKVIDDADKQIKAMDATREMCDSWDDIPRVFPYSEKFISIEGFKIIKKELFLNVGLALAAVGVIVLLTVPSPLAALIITVNVGFCIVEILGFMHALGIAIDSVSVINIVLAVGLSVDYSAHVGHCFMVKAGKNKNERALESLADIGSAVLSGALTTFLAVVVLLFSSSYVFVTLSIQFALTVGLGVTHGLVLLPVLLSLLGPKAFSSAEEHGQTTVDDSREFTDDPKEA